MSDKINQEIDRRRTFAIISHPDAGKTTLTEKLLLYGGALRLAGTVKSRKSKQYAVSDWMEIEKQRGISITSSALQFEYNGYKINILDTPGHQDFCEDTYRTLIAADSAVMLIDAAKGVEEQTKKLFKVCRNKGIPIFTFINKLDRHGKMPLDLIDELERLLGIRSYPMNWPVGLGIDFKGIYDRSSSKVVLFDSDGRGKTIVPTKSGDLRDPNFTANIDDALLSQLEEDNELLSIAGDEFDPELVASGEQTPIYFGSALTNFGVSNFLESFIKLSPAPHERQTSIGKLDPHNEEFSGFVFKIQANMNPAHRDRIAFIKICSGVFKRGMVVKHVPTDKKIRLAQSKQLFAQDCETLDEAYPGDIIGVSDPGFFSIGDAITEKNLFEFEPIPSFLPEHFARVQLKDAMKRKQFIKGINQLTQEGAVQKYSQLDIGVEAPIVGAVGLLQFEVLQYRLTMEYGVDVNITNLPYTVARWVDGELPAIKQLNQTDKMVVKNDRDKYLALFRNEWSLRWELENNTGVELLENPPK
ncbi:MAG: peptide chain release factor 3 [Firmicutes bacterium]|nr:peptide chain release factor 3 [Bacillota bacterium]